MDTFHLCAEEVMTKVKNRRTAICGRKGIGIRLIGVSKATDSMAAMYI